MTATVTATTERGLRRLGGAVPPPFVGRVAERDALARALDEAPVAVVQGAVGSGKTRLARLVAADAEAARALRVAFVRVFPGDRAIAVRARAERALAALPGGLVGALTAEQHLLVIDDAHHLADADLAAELASMLPGDGALGRVLFLTRDALALPRTTGAFHLELGGLDEAAARELWTHLEETYGPTPATAVDAALTRTRGMPLALRREYARAAAGAEAWQIEGLTAPVRAALEALSVLRLPAAPAAVAAMVPELAPEPALIELVSRQLIDPLDDGRFAVHDIVRDEVLGAIAAAVRVELERAAAALMITAGRGRTGDRRLAWDAGDDGALGALDPVERLREAVLHLRHAGDGAAATALLVERRALAMVRGAGGEVESLLRSADPADRELRTVRAEIAARAGRVAEALELLDGRAPGFDPVAAAQLAFRAGDVAAACRELAELAERSDVEIAARASAALVEVELLRGNGGRAQVIASAAFARAPETDAARAQLHLALASVEEHLGHITAARIALARAASACKTDGGTAALIEARRATCLAREGRLSEASAALVVAEGAVRELDAIAIADEISRCRALVLARRGELGRASDELRTLVAALRHRGDEMGALRAEVDLAAVLIDRGELIAAAELAAACATSASRRKLAALAARAELLGAAVDVAELRIDAARGTLDRLLVPSVALALDVDSRVRATVLRAEVDAWSGTPRRLDEVLGVAGLAETAAELIDEVDRGAWEARLAFAAGDVGMAFEQTRATAARAERNGRTAELATALVLVARFELARGNRPLATAAASRAARESLPCGLTAAHVSALLTLAALARDDGDVTTASAYARDACERAAAAGLPSLRLAAIGALEAIAGGDVSRADARSAAAATMSAQAIDASARLLGDLGLTASRPFRVIGHDGTESHVADASADLLRLGERSLAIDGIREIILRAGVTLADLRRRSLLKRLLFLFAAAPGKIFSKEDIVQTVWNVEYHPLRHDAALFTNIMRIRRLLGEDGAELIRVSEEGYRFVPPRDFVFLVGA